MLTAFRLPGAARAKNTLNDRYALFATPISEAARHRIGHATPGRDCPACPAPRDAHDGWGCERTGCPLPIHSLALTPVGGVL